jgi:hypothetical protein
MSRARNSLILIMYAIVMTMLIAQRVVWQLWFAMICRIPCTSPLERVFVDSSSGPIEFISNMP